MQGPQLTFYETRQIYMSNLKTQESATEGFICKAKSITRFIGSEPFHIILTLASILRLSLVTPSHLPTVSLNHIDSEKRTPYVTAMVNGKTLTDVLIDRGAGLTIIDEKLIKNLPNVTFLPSQFKALSANGKVVTFTCSAFISITIGNETNTVLAHVLPEAPTQLTVGTDFLYRFPQLTFNWRSNQMFIGNSVVPLTGTYFLDPISQGVLKLDANVTLPARSNCRFLVPVAQKYAKVDAVTFHPRGDLSEKFGVHFACSVSKPNEGRILVSVLNTQKHDVVLKKSTRLGFTRVYSELAEVNVMQMHQNSLMQTDTEFKQWLRSQIDLKETDLTEHQTGELIEHLAKFRNLYSTSETDIGRTDKIIHYIDTGNHRPIKQRPYRMSPMEKEYIIETVKTMNEKGIVSESNSPWSSPIVLVTKKDSNQLRFCIDFRKVNNITHKDVYPPPD